MANELSPAEFWDQSPRSFVSIMDGCARRAKRSQEAMLVQAWNTEAFARMAAKDFKRSLDHIFKSRPRRRQSPEEMLAILMQAKAGGAPLNITEIN